MREIGYTKCDKLYDYPELMYIKPKQYRKSDISRLGKTVFITREEAETILEAVGGVRSE